MQSKTATLGVAPQRDLEISFASVAFATLRDKVPLLVQGDTLRGFQLLDKSDDNKKAAGVFGARVGSRWFYMPSFFVRNELKGSELLFTDRIFAPLTEAWINYFLSKTGSGIGTGQSFERARDRFASDPSMNQILYGRKMGELSHGRKIGEFLDAKEDRDFAFYEAAGDCYHTKMAAFTKAAFEDVLEATRAPFALTGVDVDSLARESRSAFGQLRKLAATRPVVRRWLKNQYGDDCIAKWASCHIGLARLSTAKKATTKKASKEALRARIDLDPVVTGALRILKFDDFKIAATSGTLESDVDPDDAERLAKEKLIVEDERSDEQTSVVVQDNDQRIGNPTKSGVYEVLTTDGPKKMFVIGRPSAQLTVQPGDEKLWTVVDPETREYICSPVTGIFVVGDQLEPAEKIYEAAQDSIPRGERAVDSGAFILVTPLVETSVPVCSTGEGRPLKLRRCWESCAQIPPFTPGTATPLAEKQKAEHLAKSVEHHLGDARVERDVHSARRSYTPRMVMFSGTASPSEIGGMTRVHKDSKYLRLKGGDSFEPKKGDGPTFALVQSPHEFARKLADAGARRVKVGVARGPQPDWVVYCGDDETFRGGRDDARLHLIAKHAMRVDTADQLLGLAARQGVSQAWVGYPEYVVGRVRRDGVKRAFTGALDMAPPFPEFSEDTYALGRDNVRMLPNEGLEQPAPEREGNYAPEIEDPYLRYRAEDFAPATQQQLGPVEQAMEDENHIEAGTKLLQMLLDNTSIDREIRTAAKKTMETVNQYGRLLYSIYWHYEEFEEAFGQERMPQLEDTLRNTFESIGELALQLSERLQNQNLSELMDVDISPMAEE